MVQVFNVGKLGEMRGEKAETLKHTQLHHSLPEAERDSSDVKMQLQFKPAAINYNVLLGFYVTDQKGKQL